MNFKNFGILFVVVSSLFVASFGDVSQNKEEFVIGKDGKPAARLLIEEFNNGESKLKIKGNEIPKEIDRVFGSWRHRFPTLLQRILRQTVPEFPNFGVPPFFPNDWPWIHSDKSGSISKRHKAGDMKSEMMTMSQSIGAPASMKIVMFSNQKTPKLRTPPRPVQTHQTLQSRFPKILQRMKIFPPMIRFNPTFHNPMKMENPNVWLNVHNKERRLKPITHFERFHILIGRIMPKMHLKLRNEQSKFSKLTGNELESVDKTKNAKPTKQTVSSDSKTKIHPKLGNENGRVSSLIGNGLESVDKSKNSKPTKQNLNLIDVHISDKNSEKTAEKTNPVAKVENKNDGKHNITQGDSSVDSILQDLKVKNGSSASVKETKPKTETMKETQSQKPNPADRLTTNQGSLKPTVGEKPKDVKPATPKNNIMVTPPPSQIQKIDAVKIDPLYFQMNKGANYKEAKTPESNKIKPVERKRRAASVGNSTKKPAVNNVKPADAFLVIPVKSTGNIKAIGKQISHIKQETKPVQPKPVLPKPETKIEPKTVPKTEPKTVPAQEISKPKIKRIDRKEWKIPPKIKIKLGHGSTMHQTKIVKITHTPAEPEKFEFSFGDSGSKASKRHRTHGTTKTAKIALTMIILGLVVAFFVVFAARSRSDPGDLNRVNSRTALYTASPRY